MTPIKSSCGMDRNSLWPGARRLAHPMSRVSPPPPLHLHRTMDERGRRSIALGKISCPQPLVTTQRTRSEHGKR